MADTSPTPVKKGLLALGAHYDDCPFGIAGILIKAVRRGYRVVVLNLIGDYSNFAPAKERSDELKRGCIEICQEYGAEMRFLDWKGHHFRDTPAASIEVARVVAEVRPDVAFLLWPHDRHGDHVAASRICETALRHAGPLLNVSGFRPPRAYYYDNGPRHTIGFEPNTYVDVSEEWDAAREWLARFMRLVYGPPREPSGEHPAVSLKDSLGAYRGSASGVHRAEALHGLDVSPVDIL